MRPVFGAWKQSLRLGPNLARARGIAEHLVRPARGEVGLGRPKLLDQVGERLSRLGLAPLARVEHRDRGAGRGVAREHSDLLLERGLGLSESAEAGQAIPSEELHILQRDGTFGGSRPRREIQFGERSGIVPAVVKDFSEDLTRDAPRRVALERGARFFLRGGQVSFRQGDPGQVLVRARGAGVADRFRVAARLGEVAGLHEVLGERHHDLRAAGREPGGRLQGRERLLVTAQLHERLGVHLPHVRHAGLLLEQSRQDSGGFGIAPSHERGEAGLELLHGADAVARRGKILLREIHGRSADVPERRELLDLLRIRAARALERPRQTRELGAHRAERRRKAGREVVLLARIGDDVVELGPRRLDVLVPDVGQRSEIAPAQVETRIERLAVDAALVCLSGRASREGRRERVPGQPRRDRGACDLGDGRKHVRQRDRSGHGLAGPPRLRELDHQRNVDRFPVEQDAVLVLAVVVQALAVIREEDDERAVVDLLVLQIL